MNFNSRITSMSMGLLLLFGPESFAADENGSLDASLSLGITVTDGNSDTSSIHLSLDSSQTSGNSETLLGGKFNYGEENDDKNTENLYTFAQYNFHLDEAKRFYLNMKAEYSYDEIANVDYRGLVGPPGLGYLLVKSDTTQWAFEVAFQYLWEDVGGTILVQDERDGKSGFEA